MLQFEDEFAIKAGYGGAGAQCSLADVLGDDGSVPPWYEPFWEAAINALYGAELSEYEKADRAAKAVARAALSLIYPAQ